MKTATPSVAEIIGANVRRLRVARGWSQQTLAVRCKLMQAAVSSIEVARHDPQAETIARVAAGLGVSTRTLVSPK